MKSLLFYWGSTSMKQKILKLLLMTLLALGIGIQTPLMPTGSHPAQSTVVKAAKKHQS